MKSFSSILLIVIGLCSAQLGKAQLTLTADSVFQSSTCAGSEAYLLYTVSGGSYNFGNVFTAELSQDFDPICTLNVFSNPVDVGILPFWDSGVIPFTIPASTPVGSYRLRIRSTSPVDTSTISTGCVWVVYLPTIAASIVAVPDSDTVCVGDSVQLSVLPLIGTSYLWSTGETTTSITVGVSGSYTCTITDTLGCETTSEPKNVEFENCVGIEEEMVEEGFRLYPNPTNGTTTLFINLRKTTRGSIVVYDIMGKRVYGDFLNLNPGANRVGLNLSELSAGIYTVQLSFRNGISTRKLLIVE